MEYSIQEVARAAGTTSRTLRHYDRVGLVPPARVGANGYRYYDDRALVRLQRVLLLRELGLGLEAIGEVLAAQDRHAATGGDPAAAEAAILRTHLELLRGERDRVTAQIGAVERTVAALEGGGGRSRAAGAGDRRRTGTERTGLMQENMFEGFDHTRHRDEVVERWGADAYETGDRWWRGLGPDERAEWQRRVQRLGADWVEAFERGEDPASPAAQDLARRHVEWLRSVPGTPASSPDGDVAGYVLGLGEMYVADDRFGANYGGAEGAGFVRDALAVYVERELR